MKILVTGSNGLIGGEAVSYFDALGHTVIGADNNWRKLFFGKDGDTKWNLHRIYHYAKNYFPTDTDITVEGQVWSLFKDHGPFDAVIHCAAQPSHDYASKNPALDYEVNVRGTENLLKRTLQDCPDAVFIFTSTNKVYDDAVNSTQLYEYETRYDKPSMGFDENTPVGASNIFGSHKLAADQLVQEYAKKGLKTVVVRGGCLTGPGHSGVEMHGFLSYLLKCAITGKPYTIFGYKGKQVRDNIHSHDVCRIFEEIIKNPRSGEVYNIGGGRENSVSVLEAITLIEQIAGRKINYTIDSQARSGDHQWYITDMSKFQRDYPGFKLEKSLIDILEDMALHTYWGRESDHDKTFLYPELNENSTVVDAGGYRGTWANSIVKRYNCNVLIYEPIKEFADACVYRFRNNPKVKVFNEGLSNTSGNLNISVDGVASSLYTGNRTEAVKMVDIREAAKLWPETIDLISINTEGSEYGILQRLLDVDLIKRFRNVQVQFHNVVSGWQKLHESIRERLSKTHDERFSYGPLVWESWKVRE